ncbi:molybdenum cofactor guanylyltransferase [Candidatus Desantisbacteria bacterium]|nr:molybdenum cofactor guanylyltransferase [Candidatus Desantisbacteria bacterium]
MSELNAIINAGGQSLRFGSDKAEMMLEGKRVIEILIERLQGVCSQIIIVSNQLKGDGYHGVRIVKDVICGIGPLGGIHAGLLASNTHHNLVIACDMPFINIEFIKYMIAQVKPEDDAIIPMIHNRAEPLCGIYAGSCIPVIEGLAGTTTGVHPEKKARGFCVLRLLDEVKVRYIEEEIIRQFDPQMRMFFNINTVEELQQAYE